MRIGTRASALALAQARWVAGLLEAAPSPQPVEIVEITTLGDRGERLLDKARWTSELERALLEGRIDVAVHSAKDVPGELGARYRARSGTRSGGSALTCSAAPRRWRRCRSGRGSEPAACAAPRSCGRCATICGSSSCEGTSIRGCASSPPARRMRSCSPPPACAGWARLADAGGTLTELVPAPGQGALALQTRAGEGGRVRVARPTPGHRPACSPNGHLRSGARGIAATPRSAPWRRSTAADTVELRAWVGLPDGSEWISDCASGAAAEVGAIVAERTISVGARALLTGAERLAEAAR